VIPSEITKALEGLGSSIHEIAGIPKESGGPSKRVDMGSTETATLSRDTDRELTSANKAVEDAIAEAEHAANPGAHAAPKSDPSSGAAGADDVPDAPLPPATGGDDTSGAPPQQ
jgi:hypothetical protein